MHKLLLATAAGALVCAPAVFLLLPPQADGNEHYMSALPASSKFKCLNCHTIANPNAARHDLNAFGNAFSANGKVWDQALALMNSDGDKCSNGFELGDLDGDGVFDRNGAAQENSNPGDPADCNIALTQETWSAIKEIFKGSEWP